MSELNALQHTNEVKGSNSYYYAHDKAWNVPDCAKQITGEGIITGGTPKRVGAEAPAEIEVDDEVDRLRLALKAAQLARPRFTRVCAFALSDEGESVKLYVDLPMQDRRTLVDGSRIRHDCGVSAIFRENSFTVLVHKFVVGEQAEQFEFRVPALYDEIVPDKCLYKISQSRLVIKLQKEASTIAWPSLTKDDHAYVKSCAY
ncbi:hypothetical protein M885DRAFT_612065 [Pelagophyceae sp. CCMP2097]|nr:hypothetical protein M885DRAFT_612065 [Pelagophyceae sp. CCMP2097]|mmetsp:Transcript_18770/g.63400  ORF Transcript_18770/g.63400 Transcript_18770/m.63400 type:complete len:202 (-) Transcript_18770:26-631(-)